jgi:hypothetical protein
LERLVRLLKGNRETKTFQLRGSRLSLCFMASTSELPFWFRIVSTFVGTTLPPTPAVVESATGITCCDTSSSPLIILSRMSAMPATFCRVTLRPCFANIPCSCAKISGVAQVIGRSRRSDLASPAQRVPCDGPEGADRQKRRQAQRAA